MLAVDKLFCVLDSAECDHALLPLKSSQAHAQAAAWAHDNMDIGRREDAVSAQI